MAKLLDELNEIINNGQSYWLRLKALRSIKINQRPGADAARQMLYDFLSLQDRHSTVTECEWNYVKTTLVHPYWLMRPELLEDWKIVHNANTCWKPRGMMFRRGNNDHESRRSRYMCRRFPALCKNGNDDRYFEGGAWAWLYQSDFRALSRGRFHRYTDADKRVAARLTQQIAQRYDDWQHETFPLPPSYHHGKMGLAEFQVIAPEIVAQLEHARHIESVDSVQLPYAEFNGHRITLEIEEIYTKEYADYHHGAGQHVKTLRRVKLWNAQEYIKTITPTWTITSDTVEQTMAAVKGYNTHLGEHDYPANIEKCQAACVKLVNRSWTDWQEYQQAVKATGEGRFYGGKPWGTFTKSLYEYTVKEPLVFTGEWLLRLLTQYFHLSKVKVSKDLKRVQLSLYCDVRLVGTYQFPQTYQFYERTLNGEHWDYCLYQPDTQETFHDVTLHFIIH